jgi:hypothetical protein
MIGHSSSHFMVKPPLLSCLINEGALGSLFNGGALRRVPACGTRH